MVGLLSAPRMSTYLTACNSDVEAAVELYRWNLDISMALFESIHYLEVATRNKIDVALTGLAGRLVAEAVAGQAARFDLFARLKHRPFPGGRLLRMPTLALAMLFVLRVYSLLAQVLYPPPVTLLLAYLLTIQTEACRGIFSELLQHKVLCIVYL
jgi:hypothetical protein